MREDGIGDGDFGGHPWGVDRRGGQKRIYVVSIALGVNFIGFAPAKSF